ncbi:carbohydrate ABC transporter permease [Actinomyces ruminis]|uniref:Sugar ABC transporter permease n=1 Tax=Actinomyces ruminis TaxID=1937003 RepID=A0ABX4MCV7_9ACTO|nr:sugar ABC transporter permease [Actinomyces ruminis]PHP53286.1 sugar ABC transporter permease [Actinomyces ruminis]
MRAVIGEGAGRRGNPTSESSSRPTRSRQLSAKSRESLVAAAFLAPAVVVIVVFVIYPMVSAAYLSLTSWSGFGTQQVFTGLANYKHLTHDPAVINSLAVTVIYAAGVAVLSVVSGMTIALLLDAPIRGRAIYRGIYFLPTVTSSVAAAIIWKYVLDPSGILNKTLESLGLAGYDWLGHRWSALTALVLLTVWKNLGFNAIMYLTALQTLPVSCYEAAALDGAGAWVKTRHITIPLLRPMTFFVVVQALITAFQSFDLVYVLTGGGPSGGTDVLGMLMYRTSFRLGDFGYGAAIAFVCLLLVLGVTAVQWRWSGSGESDLA